MHLLSLQLWYRIIIIKESINVQTLWKKVIFIAPIILTIQNMMTLSLKANIKWFIRILFFLKINFMVKAHILMIIIRKECRDQWKNLLQKDNWVLVKILLVLIRVTLQIIWIEDRLKKQKKYNSLKTSLCLKENLMVILITIKIISAVKAKNNNNSDL